MKSGIQFEQGEIVLVPFPFSDLKSVKQRPVLVLSNNGYNKRAEDIVTCGITSNLKDSECSVLIYNHNLLEGKLPVKSRIKVDKIFTLKQTLVKKRIARIDKKIFDQVRKELLKLTASETN